MSDTRTGEQRAADENLTEAIKQCMTAYGWDDGLLTDYVVAVIQQKFDDEGGMRTVYGNLYSPNDMPHYRIIGLLDCALLTARSGFHGQEDVA